VRSVGSQIDDDLVKLTRIDGDQGQLGGTLEFDLDGCRQSGTDEVESLLDDGFDGRGFAFCLLRAAESKNVNMTILAEAKIARPKPVP